MGKIWRTPILIREVMANNEKQTIGMTRKKISRRRPLTRTKGKSSNRIRRVAVVLTRKLAGRKNHLPVS